MKTVTTVKNEVRAKAVKELLELLEGKYGKEKCGKIGDSEIAVAVDTAEDGSEIFMVISPTIKDYCDRKTKTKVIKAFNFEEEKEKFSSLLKKREEEARISKENKEKKIKKDMELREKRRKEREEKQKELLNKNKK